MSQNPFEDNAPDKNALQMLIEKFRTLSKKASPFFAKCSSLVGRLPFMPKPARWEEEGADSKSDRSGPAFMISLIVFIIYGLVGGYIIASRVQFNSWRFSAFAYSVSIADGRLLSSPITITMSIVFIIVGAFVYLAFAMIIYSILRLLFFKNDKIATNDALSFCFMCGLVAAIFMVILVCFTPGLNVFARGLI